MKRKRPKLFLQNENNNYSERTIDYNRLEQCEKCCCNSCTGFKCPWRHKAPKGIWCSVDNPHKYPRSSIRCGICLKNFEFDKIFDCDYYTYYKRKKYFIKRRKHKKDKLDEIIEKLDKLLKT